MELSDPTVRVILPLKVGRKAIELPFESREEARALIAAIARDVIPRLPTDGEPDELADQGGVPFSVACPPAVPEPCPAVADSGDECIGRALHPLPHRTAGGYEWSGDLDWADPADTGQPEPALCPARHASTGMPCVLDAGHLDGDRAIAHRTETGWQWTANSERPEVAADDDRDTDDMGDDPTDYVPAQEPELCGSRDPDRPDLACGLPKGHEERNHAPSDDPDATWWPVREQPEAGRIEKLSATVAKVQAAMNQMPMCGVSGDGGRPCQRLEGHPPPHRSASGWTWTSDEANPTVTMPVAEKCTSRFALGSVTADGRPQYTSCVREHGHDGDHRDGGDWEWPDGEAMPDDGPEPVYATSGPRCGDVCDYDGTGVRRACTAQRGHGGEVHVEHSVDGTVVATWPRDPDVIPLRDRVAKSAGAPSPLELVQSSAAAFAKGAAR